MSGFTRGQKFNTVQHVAFPIRCDKCERLVIDGDVRRSEIQNKAGEVANFALCCKCYNALAVRIESDAVKIYGVGLDVVKHLRKLLTSTLECTKASNGSKLNVLSLGDLVRLWLIQSGECALSGRAMDPNGDGLSKPSVDRIDSSGPYKLGNVWLVCQVANIMKNEYPLDVFTSMCRDIADHAGRKKALEES